jgi:hypothetical protein
VGWRLICDTLLHEDANRYRDNCAFVIAVLRIDALSLLHRMGLSILGVGAGWHQYGSLRNHGASREVSATTGSDSLLNLNQSWIKE